MPDVTITLTITETAGELAVVAQIPDGSEKTLARALAESLLDGANQMLNTVFKQDRRVEKVTNN